MESKFDASSFTTALKIRAARRDTSIAVRQRTD
jgi:hypothetical protein